MAATTKSISAPPTGCRAISSNAVRSPFPSAIPAAKARIHDEILPAYLADTVKARLQQPDGTYLRASRVLKDSPAFSAQDFLVKLAEGKADPSAIPQSTPPKSAKVSSKVSASPETKKADAAD